MKRNSSTFLLLTLIFCHASAAAQDRLEAIQWYTNSGSNDAFEIKLYNRGQQVFYSAHQDVIETSSPLLPDLSTYYPRESFDYEERIENQDHKTDQSIEEKIISYIDGIPEYIVINQVSSESHLTETYQYNYDSNELIALYRTWNKGEDGFTRTWYDPVTLEQIYSDDYFFSSGNYVYHYQYDEKHRPTREIIFSDKIRIREKYIVYMK